MSYGIVIMWTRDLGQPIETCSHRNYRLVPLNMAIISLKGLSWSIRTSSHRKYTCVESPACIAILWNVVWVSRPKQSAKYTFTCGIDFVGVCIRDQNWNECTNVCGVGGEGECIRKWKHLDLEFTQNFLGKLAPSEKASFEQGCLLRVLRGGVERT